MISKEHRIENRIVANLGRLGYENGLWIRRARICRGYGAVDLMILPQTGKHRLVLVEVKQDKSGEATGKVIGQLLRYYVGSLQMGLHGLRIMREFARTSRARTPLPKSLKMLSGGRCEGEDWELLSSGRRLNPNRIAAIIGLSRPPSESLRTMRDWVYENSGLDIRIVVAYSRDRLEEWRPRNDRIPL